MDRLWPDSGARRPQTSCTRPPITRGGRQARRTASACAARWSPCSRAVRCRRRRAFERGRRGRPAAGDRAVESRWRPGRAACCPSDPYESWAFQPAAAPRSCCTVSCCAGRAGGRELVALDPTDEEAHLGVAPAALPTVTGAGRCASSTCSNRSCATSWASGRARRPTTCACQALDTPAAAPALRSTCHLDHTPARRGTPPWPGRRCSSADRGRGPPRVRHQRQGPPLVKAANWLTHLDYDWGSPVWSHWWQALSAGQRLVRYDERGCGLSDWAVAASSFTLDAWVARPGDRRRHPGAGAIRSARHVARRADRPHLCGAAPRAGEPSGDIYGTCARATWARAGPTERRTLAALGELIRISWGSEEPGFRQVYDARFLPDGPLELWRAFDELQRRSTSPENAYQLWRAFGDLDASEAARGLDVPTLILHPAGTGCGHSARPRTCMH